MKSLQECLTAIDTAIKARQEANAENYWAIPELIAAAAYATFSFFASSESITGNQASHADLGFIGRTRGLKCPFGMVVADLLLYPQMDHRNRVLAMMDSWQPWLAQEAKKRLAESSQTAHPDVVAHWKKLAAYDEPTEVKS